MRTALRTPKARTRATRIGCAMRRAVFIEPYNAPYAEIRSRLHVGPRPPAVGRRGRRPYTRHLNPSGLQRLRRGRGALDATEHSKNGHLLLQALESELAEGLGIEASDDAVQRVLRDDHLTRFRDAALQPRRDIDRCAKDRVVDAFLGADVAHDCQTALRLCFGINRGLSVVCNVVA